MERSKSLMQMERQAMSLAERFLAITVTDNPTCETAGAALNKVMAMEQAWDDHTLPNIARWHDGHKAALAERSRVANQLTRAERWLKEQIGAWKLKLKNQEARAQIAAEAKSEKMAEQDRRKEIEALRKNGERAEAQRLMRRPLVVAPVVARVEQPILHKISVAEKWDFEITDEAALPPGYTKRVPDLAKIRQTVEAMKSETRIPGVRVFATPQVSAGAAGSETAS